ncbi:probable inactive heme oxygenase 2, chloroplastic isoform X1 [Coffea eugenioides]|uniref:probable inactive heme oxygenase 2, chloroplastic isoform X1 n=2 Tax=Coffea eugenioides TaxID=49369 RepID=UPI000F60A666|nr:probable inactive heme oxygenase 2, chloroplastic isoform X1 [Coffea eugenioides]
MNAATMAYFNLSILPLQDNSRLLFVNKFSNFPTAEKRNSTNSNKTKRPTNFYCSHSNTIAVVSPSETEEDGSDDNEEGGQMSSPAMMGSAPPVRRRRRRYRKLCPGENKGITEEMRFVAMKLRNSGKPKKIKKGRGNAESIKEVETGNSADSGEDQKDVSISEEKVEKDDDGSNANEDIWQPSLEGFLKYLVDSKLVFSTIERIVDESSDVSYVYFRKTGLERSECIAKDLEWFSRKGNAIPAPSNPGVTYVQYLKELAETSPPLFLSHFYNIYFSHIAGGQVIAKKVSEKLLEGRKLEFYAWEGEEEELLKGVREKLNMLGEHWSRDEKNRCLREATKAFRYLGQIVRLIIL